MAETLGSLCDKLTIVKLKQWHTEDTTRQKSLEQQEERLQDEINAFISAAVAGSIPSDRLTFASNKVFKKEGNTVENVLGTIGEVFSRLANVNCELWHEQEKVYDFEAVPAEGKNKVVKKLALLNLERNKCIDRIDSQFQAFVQQGRK